MSTAIVLAAFGASSATARLAYRNFESAIERAHPGLPVLRAYTSRRVVERARAEGTPIPGLEETAEQVRAAGYERIVVLPLLTVAGEEYSKVARFCWGGPRVACAAPLLAEPGDASAAMDALRPQILPDATNIIVCHGNRTHEQYNALLLELASVAESTHSNCVVASIEGAPGTTPLARARKLAHVVGHAHFVPFMLVAGQHISQDVMGRGDDSWMSRVGARVSTCAPPMAWSAEVVHLYLARLDKALARLEDKQ